MLGRSGDLNSTSDGMISIAEYVPGYEAIQSTPQLPRIGTTGFTAWTTLLDGVTVNGHSVTLNSSINGIPNGKALALLDSGSTLASVPKFISDAIYSGMPNAVWDEPDNLWFVPCNATADVRFVFGYAFFA